MVDQLRLQELLATAFPEQANDPGNWHNTHLGLMTHLALYLGGASSVHILLTPGVGGLCYVHMANDEKRLQESFPDSTWEDYLGWVSYIAPLVMPPPKLFKVNKRCTFWVSEGLPPALGLINHHRQTPLGLDSGGFKPPLNAILEVAGDLRKMRIAKDGLQQVRSKRDHFVWDAIALASQWVTLDPKVKPDIQTAIQKGILSPF